MSLPSSLDPILQKNIFYKDGRSFIHYAEEDIEYNDNFKLFITTNDKDPHYLSDIFIKMNIVNFSVSFEGLEDQFSMDLIKLEKTEIVEQRDLNIVNLAKSKIILKEYEEKMLQLLAEN